LHPGHARPHPRGTLLTPLTLAPGATVMFTGDSITDCRRMETDEPLGYGYPLHVAGQWGLSHLDRPVRWLNSGIAGNKVLDLEPRWQHDVLDAGAGVVSILVGINDAFWHTYAEDGRMIPAAEYRDGYDRLLAPLAAAGTALILIEPFLLPVSDLQRRWRYDVDEKIEVVRGLAKTYEAHLLAADEMFTGLAATTGPEYWAPDGVHPSPAGHAALAAAWLRLVE
ncbi:MAG: GDSL-type esterase/lipase family protein, partial [Trebonia sp.]